MNTCQTCKHWQRDYNIDWLREMRGEFHFVDYGNSEPPKRDDYRPCALTTYEESSFNHPESKALSVDAENYHAALYTAPDFGCVQWEAKE